MIGKFASSFTLAAYRQAITNPRANVPEALQPWLLPDEKTILLTHGAHDLLALAQRRGVASHRLLSGTRVFESDLHKPLARVSHLDWLQIIHNCQSQLPTAEIPCLLGASLLQNSYISLGQLLQTAPNLAVALRHLLFFRQQLTSAVMPQLYRQQHDIVLEFIPVLPMAQCQHFFIITLFSLLLTLIKQQLNQASAVTLELQHGSRQPDVSQDLSSILSWQLGAKVIYPAQRDCLRIPLSLWTAPFQHACAAKFSVAKRNCRQMHRVLLRRRSLIEQIYRLQKRQLPDVLQLSVVAEHLHIPAAQLQRLLKTQHSSLSKITDQVRHDLTRKCLTQADFSNRRMADRLGYSDEHNFRRAFKRWTGVLPSMLRRY
jgi:AraC-like DNA-binding protein